MSKPRPSNRESVHMLRTFALDAGMPALIVAYFLCYISFSSGSYFYIIRYLVIVLVHFWIRPNYIFCLELQSEYYPYIFLVLCCQMNPLNCETIRLELPPLLDCPRQPMPLSW